MKKIFIGVFALTVVTSTAVFAVKSNNDKKSTVTCSNGCAKTANCVAGTTCAVMPGCVCK